MNKIVEQYQVPVVTKDDLEVIRYKQYEEQVLNRAAHSIGCDPSDLNDYLVLEMYVDGLDQFEAARRLEEDLAGECYYYNHVVHYDTYSAPF